MEEPIENWKQEFENGAFRLWNSKQKKLMLNFISSLLTSYRGELMRAIDAELIGRAKQSGGVPIDFADGVTMAQTIILSLSPIKGDNNK